MFTIPCPAGGTSLAGEVYYWVREESWEWRVTQRSHGYDEATRRGRYGEGSCNRH